MAEKQPKAAAAAETVDRPVTIEVLHPITHNETEYGRGLHQLQPELAKFFLAIRVHNRVLGPQPVARIPLPPEEAKRGEVKHLIAHGQPYRQDAQGRIFSGPAPAALDLED